LELAANGRSTREIGEVLGVDHLDIVGANAPPIDPEAERQREQETARVNHRPTMPRSFDIR
jgi:hypothetical protein